MKETDTGTGADLRTAAAAGAAYADAMHSAATSAARRAARKPRLYGASSCAGGADLTCEHFDPCG